jgi:ferredoxin
MHQIQLINSDEHFQCNPGSSLLEGMQRLSRKGIPIGCRGGGCGVCRVQVLSGDYQCKKMSRDHVSAGEQSEGIGLACRLYPESDLEVEVLGLKNCKKKLQIT